MIKRLVNFILTIFCLLLGFWLVQNLDYDSVFTRTGAMLRYEFSKENIKQCLIRLDEIIKNKINNHV